jgi:hypothetical protein
MNAKAQARTERGALLVDFRICRDEPVDN